MGPASGFKSRSSKPCGSIFFLGELKTFYQSGVGEGGQFGNGEGVGQNGLGSIGVFGSGNAKITFMRFFSFFVVVNLLPHLVLL